jgi:hypothetical protein
MAIFRTTTGSDPNVILRDYQDAADIFTPNNNDLLPKAKRWFTIYFQLNQAAQSVVNTEMLEAVNSDRINWRTNSSDYATLGILVKTVQLPNFTFEVKKNNQYNRSSLNVTKINYQPINLTFHDDSINFMSAFWYGYYQYMIQDPRYSTYSGSQPGGLDVPSQWDQDSASYSTIYNPVDDFNGRFGLDTDLSNGTSQTQFGRNEPFFSSIRIYQFTRSSGTNAGAMYHEYVLVNPIISSFSHDQDLSYSTSEFATNSMQIEFETVLYSTGTIASGEIGAFTLMKDLYLDTTPSPNGGDITSETNTSVVGIIGDAVATASSLGQAAVTTIVPSTLNNIDLQSSVTSSITAPTSISQTISVPLL